jgi:hypothetical protein
MSNVDPRGDLVNPSVTYETRDVNVRAVTRFGIALAGIVVVACSMLWFLFHEFAAREVARHAQPSSLIQREAPKQPPEPRLQANPPQELRQVRADEDAVLDSYGWVDPAKGVVRIPVSRAMDLAAERGLKAVRK